MSIRDEAHFELSSSELAAWIERQGDQWWSVDGDRILTGRLSFPSPGDELAAALRRINRPLLVQDRRPRPQGKGEVIGGDRLDELATTLDAVSPIPGEEPASAQDRLFYFSWKGSPDEWLLLEDQATAASSRADAASAAEKS